MSYINVYIGKFEESIRFLSVTFWFVIKKETALLCVAAISGGLFTKQLFSFDSCCQKSHVFCISAV